MLAYIESLKCALALHADYVFIIILIPNNHYIDCTTSMSIGAALGRRTRLQESGARPAEAERAPPLVALHIHELVQRVPGPTGADASAMTWSMSLYAAGISSMNAAESRYSMPTIDARRSSIVNVARARFREYSRPAPCGDEFSASALPSPCTT